MRHRHHNLLGAVVTIPEPPDGPRRSELSDLADERSRLSRELAAMRKALQLADAAQQALSDLRGKVGNASRWSAYDTFFGGGKIATAILHRRLDESADLAAEADYRLSLLQTELAGLHGITQTFPLLAISERTKLVDMWFDNIFTDMAIRDRVQQARQNVDRSLQAVQEVQEQLTSQLAQAQAKLTSIEAKLRDLPAR
jgi:DNA repair exonuclease SbcCD ATPase subunit